MENVPSSGKHQCASVVTAALIGVSVKVGVTLQWLLFGLMQKVVKVFEGKTKIGQPMERKEKTLFVILKIIGDRR